MGGPDLSGPCVLTATSFAAPALCTYGPDLVLAWTGTDRHLNVARLRRAW